MIKLRYVAVLLIALISSDALAFTIVGTNFFLQGLNHPLAIPAHLMTLFALACLLGQQGGDQIKIVLPVFMVVLALALLATLWYRVRWDTDMILLPLAGVIGLILALRLRLPLWLCLLTAIAIAIIIGLDSDVPKIPGLQSRKIYSSLFGTWTFVSLSLIVVSMLALLFRERLQGVILRVLGAWVTAGAILVLTLMTIQIGQA